MKSSREFGATCRSIRTRWLTALLGCILTGTVGLPSPASAQPGCSPLTSAVTDFAVASDGTAWSIGAGAANKLPGGYRIVQGNPAITRAQMPPGCRIAVEGQTPWVINEQGAIWRWSNNQWQRVVGPNVVVRGGTSVVARAVDIGASAKGVWIVAEPSVSDPRNAGPTTNLKPGAATGPAANYTIYRWTGSGWAASTAGSAVRVDVDSEGNPWVVNQAGGLYAFVKGAWRQFKSEPAADLWIHTFQEPWLVAKNGAVLHYDSKTTKWQGFGTVANAFSDRGLLAQLRQEVMRSAAPGGAAVAAGGSSPGASGGGTAQADAGAAGGSQTGVTSSGNIVIPRPNVQLNVPSPTQQQQAQRQQTAATPNLQLQVGPTQTLQITGPNQQALNLNQASPGQTNLNQLSASLNPNQPAQLVVGPATGTDTGQQLQVGGCAANPNHPSCGGNLRLTTEASKGVDVFPEPGLGGLLGSGGPELLGLAVDKPSVFMGGLTSMYQNLDRRAQEFAKACQDPLNSEHVKAMMYGVLIGSIQTPPAQRSVAQRALVENFHSYMMHRRLFIAERGKWLFDNWVLRRQTAQANAFQVFSNFMLNPKDEIGQELEAGLVLGTTGAAILVTIGSAAIYGSLQAAVVSAAVAAGVEAAGAGTMVSAILGGTATGAGGLMTGALAAGPAAIVLMGATMSTIAIIKTVEAKEYIDRLSKALDEAKRPIDLPALARTREGLGQIAYYWSRAVSESGPVEFVTNGDRKQACNELLPKLSPTPSAVTGARLRLNPAVVSLKGKTRTYNYTARDALAKSGITFAEGLRTSNAGEILWKARASATQNCFDPKVMETFEKTGQITCNPAIRKDLVKHVRWVYAPQYQMKTGRLPADTVSSGVVHGQSLRVCRADMGDGWHPGKVWEATDSQTGTRRLECFVGWGGKERTDPLFEVLTASDGAVEWVLTKQGQPIPDNAVKADTHSSGAWLYVCRADMGNGVHAGKVWGGRCHVSFNGKELAKSTYEVLVQHVPWDKDGGGPRQTYRPR